MDLPSEIRIGPFDYSVVEISAEQAEELRDDANIDCEALVMQVNVDQAKTVVLESLTHEILHALWSLAGGHSLTTEEMWVAKMAPLLLCLVRDNPAVLRMLNEYAEITSGNQGSGTCKEIQENTNTNTSEETCKRIRGGFNA